jgi:hypothetical protein
MLNLCPSYVPVNGVIGVAGSVSPIGSKPSPPFHDEVSEASIAEICV